MFVGVNIEGCSRGNQALRVGVDVNWIMNGRPCMMKNYLLKRVLNLAALPACTLLVIEYGVYDKLGEPSTMPSETLSQQDVAGFVGRTADILEYHQHSRAIMRHVAPATVRNGRSSTTPGATEMWVINEPGLLSSSSAYKMGCGQSGRFCEAGEVLPPFNATEIFMGPEKCWRRQNRRRGQTLFER